MCLGLLRTDVKLECTHRLGYAFIKVGHAFQKVGHCKTLYAVFFK